MIYFQDSCDINKMDGKSNENAYTKVGMFSKGEEMSCGVVDVVNCSTLRWFGHLESKRLQWDDKKDIQEYTR